MTTFSKSLNFSGTLHTCLLESIIINLLNSKLIRLYWIEKILGASREAGGWYWYRLEYQHRGAVDIHGVARLGSAPDTYKLAQEIIEGHKASLTSEDLDPSLDREQIIRRAKEGEHELIAYSMIP